MSITVKLRRGTTTQHSTFTGEEAEVTVDTTKDVVVVHDGVTAGGHPMVKASSLAAVAASGDYNDLTNKPTITSGTVTSVALSAPAGFTVSGSPVTASGTLALAFDTGYALPTTTKQGQWDTAYSWGDHSTVGYLDSADIGVTVQGYNASTVIDASYVHTDNNYTTTEKSKLAGIAAGAEVNVNADWNAVSGDAQILNKPTAVSVFTNDAGYLTSYTETDPIVGAVNGLVKANGAGTISSAVAGTDYLAPAAIANMLETSDIGVTVQGYSTVLAGTTASFTTADETKLDGIEAGADVTDAANVEPIVNAHLNTSTAANGEVLSWNGTDYDWITPPAGYSDSSVDAHLNTSTATSGQVLGWTGADYDWVDQSGGGGGGALTISNKTAAYTVVAGDLGTIIQFTSTGAVTCSLTAAATLGAGFNCWIWNDKATGALTIDPSGAETIAGSATIALVRGEGVQLVCDGSNFKINAVRQSQLVQIDNGNSVIRSAATGSYSAAIGANSGASASVATAGGAMALGGSYASGTDSFAAAVANNTSSYGAKNTNSVAIGKNAASNGARAIAIGDGSNASSSVSIAIGYTAAASAGGAIAIGNNYWLGACSATGESSIAIGDSVSATQQHSVALGAGVSSAVVGKFAQSSGNFASRGDSQQASLVLRLATTDATATALRSNTSAAGTTNQVILPNNSAYAFSGIVIAKQSGSTNAASWKVEGMIVRGATAASTTLVASTVTAISNVPGWTLALSADTTNGGLAVTATGAVATNIRWVATIQTSEVTYA